MCASSPPTNGWAMGNLDDAISPIRNGRSCFTCTFPCSVHLPAARRGGGRSDVESGSGPHCGQHQRPRRRLRRPVCSSRADRRLLYEIDRTRVALRSSHRDRHGRTPPHRVGRSVHAVSTRCPRRARAWSCLGGSVERIQGIQFGTGWASRAAGGPVPAANARGRSARCGGRPERSASRPGRWSAAPAGRTADGPTWAACRRPPRPGRPTPGGPAWPARPSAASAGRNPRARCAGRPT